MYYVLDCHPPFDADFYYFEADPTTRALRWRRGQKFSIESSRPEFRPPGDPIVMTTEPDDRLRIHPEYESQPIPFMSRRLVEAMREAGVDNLDTYALELRNLRTGEVGLDHLAVNIVGMVSAADLSASDVDNSIPEVIFFNSLAVDEDRARGLLLFRLKESITTVLVHEKVKRHLEVSGIDTLMFLEPQEWAG